METNRGGKKTKVEVPWPGDESLHIPMLCLGLDWVLRAEQKNGRQPHTQTHAVGT